MKYIKRFILNILLLIDETANTILLGSPEQTITARAYAASLRGAKWACVLCKLLNYLQSNHCKKGEEPEECARDSLIALINEQKQHDKDKK